MMVVVALVRGSQLVGVVGITNAPPPTRAKRTRIDSKMSFTGPRGVGGNRLEENPTPQQTRGSFFHQIQEHRAAVGGYDPLRAAYTVDYDNGCATMMRDHMQPELPKRIQEERERRRQRGKTQAGDMNMVGALKGNAQLGLKRLGNNFNDFLDKHTGMTAAEMGKSVKGRAAGAVSRLVHGGL